MGCSGRSFFVSLTDRSYLAAPDLTFSCGSELVADTSLFTMQQMRKNIWEPESQILSIFRQVLGPATASPKKVQAQRNAAALKTHWGLTQPPSNA